MLRDLIKEGGLYTIANLLTKGVSLLLIPFYTAYFSPADYGVIDMLNLFTLFVTAVFSLQLNQGLARFVAEPTHSEKQKSIFASTAIWFTFIILFSITLLLYLIPDEFIKQLSSSDLFIPKSTYLLAVITIFLNGMFYLFGVHLRFLRMVKPFALLSFIHAIAGISIILTLVLVYDYGVSSIYLSYILIVPPLLIVQLYLLRKHISFTLSMKALKKLLTFSMPLIPAAIATMLMSFADRIYIKKYMDFTELGIYAMAGKFASIVGLIVAGFTMAITPLILHKQYEENTRNELSRIFKLYISVGTLGVLILSYFSKELVEIVTNIRFHSASEVMPILFLTSYFVGFLMFSQGLTIKKKTVITAVLVSLFSCLNIVLNHFFVPEFGSMGAAIATLIATAGYYLITFYYSQKYYAFNFPLVKILGISLLHIGLTAVFVLWDPELNFTNFLLKLAIILGYFAVLVFVKMLDINLFIDYFKGLIKKAKK